MVAALSTLSALSTAASCGNLLIMLSKLQAYAPCHRDCLSQYHGYLSQIYLAVKTSAHAYCTSDWALSVDVSTLSDTPMLAQEVVMFCSDGAGNKGQDVYTVACDAGCLRYGEGP